MLLFFTFKVEISMVGLFMTYKFESKCLQKFYVSSK